MKRRIVCISFFLILPLFSRFTFASSQDFNFLEGKTFEYKEDEDNRIIYKFKKNGTFVYTMRGRDGLLFINWSYLGKYTQSSDNLDFIVSDMKIRINGIDLTKFIDESERLETMTGIAESISGKYLIDNNCLIFEGMTFTRK